MKLSKSKLSLAKAINENGGWPERALWAVQDNCIAFFLGGKPEYKSGDRCWYSNSIDGACVGTITRDEKVTNWHQTVLSREEYYHAYPKADDDGWVEWKGGECPVGDFDEVQVKYKVDDGSGMEGCEAQELHWHHEDADFDIVAYRLHKPEVKPEFCESVMRSIPEPESHEKLSPEAIDDAKFALMSESIEESKRKLTIEQLAQDYRNKLDFAKSKQQEADEAKAASDAALGELERAGEALGLLIGIAKPDPEPELVIADWRDLKVGDLVEVVSSLSGNREGEVGTVTRFDEFDKGCEVRVHFNDDPCDYEWCVDWKFIRRP